MKTQKVPQCRWKYNCK